MENDKLAEEIIKKNEFRMLTFYDEYDEHRPVDCFDIIHIPELMQAYHEAKLKLERKEQAKKDLDAIIENENNDIC